MNHYESTKWGVHIVGPDSILAVSSFREAAEKCTQINAEIIAKYAKTATENSPLCWAKIAVWNNFNGNHDPENTDWSDLA